MSAFEDHREELEHYEQMLGRHRGRLAVALDLVTNALVLAGQHAVYCRSAQDARQPTRDIGLICSVGCPLCFLPFRSMVHH